MSFDDIVAYTYQAETLCPNCTLDKLGRSDGYKEVGWIKVSGDPEEWLDDEADMRGIDRQDERSFDSGDFPKVVFRRQIDAERCDGCGADHGRCDGCGEALL